MKIRLPLSSNPHNPHRQSLFIRRGSEKGGRVLGYESLERRPTRAEVIPLSEEIQRVLDRDELWSYDVAGVARDGDRQSYTSRCWEHACRKVRKHKKLELWASTVMALIIAVFTGTSWTSALSGLGAGLLTFMGILVIIFFFQLLFAPRELDVKARSRLKVTRDQLEEQRLKVRQVAAIAVRDHENYRDSLKADLRGTVIQVFIEDATIDVESPSPVCFFVTVQLDLWNVRENAAIVRDFSLAVNCSLGILKGTHVSLYGIAYNEPPSGTFEQKALDLARAEMPKSPLPDGYVRGRPEQGKWLRFRVDGLSFGQIPFGTHVKDCVADIALVIIDGDGQTHVVFFKPPWFQRGTVENTFGGDSISDEFAHAVLAETRNSFWRDLQKCREGLVPDENWMQTQMNMTADILRKWRGLGYETEFNHCSERATEEMNSWTPACKKAGMLLSARIEKLDEYIREIRANR